jgi:myo-inositol-1(or 4)-monophosphatase
MAVTANPRYSEEIETAERAAREAGSIIMALFKGQYDVQEKSKNNPVTSADLAANRKICEIIRGRFPQDGWLSEEDKDSSERLRASRVWVVDPIDGTKEFIEGVPQFAVSIGFVVDGRPQVAVVFNPAQTILSGRRRAGRHFKRSADYVTPRTKLTARDCWSAARSRARGSRSSWIVALSSRSGASPTAWRRSPAERVTARSLSARFVSGTSAPAC